jgi:hypothetical protein
VSEALLFLIPLAAFVALWVWERRRKKAPGPSFRPWTVRLLPRQKK